ncbi:hypothetical protein MTP99_000482 [Tenebrio molitor]|nr:hypothetical protein MTP99_000482 [Tenebrio molitor]
MNSDTICRICIEKFQNLHETYDIFDGEEPIFTLIMRCTSVQISKDDGLPDKICHVCLANLKLVLRFKSQCESSDFYLRELQQNPEEDDDAQKDCEEIQQKRKNNGIYQCPVCPYGTKSNYFMTDHMKSHDSGLEFFNCEDNKLEKYECRKCNFVTNFVVALNEHKKNTHDTPLNRQNNRNQNTKYIMKNHICRKCKFETRSMLHWIRHTQSRCREEKTEHLCWSECSLCSYRSKSAIYVRCHKNRQHKKRNPKSSSPRLKCDKCEYKTDHTSHMQSHTIRRHVAKEDIQWHKCDKCEYQGKTKGCISKHYRLNHDSSKWIKCDKCEFMGKLTNRMKQHVLLKHTPDYALKCPHCLFMTKYKPNLVRHSIKCHPEKSKENKPEKYDCKECNFVADSIATLNEHNTNVHDTQSDKQNTNRKPTAADDVNLQNHTVKNHLALEEIQWHKCPRCYYQGKTKNALDKHHRVHHDDSKWVKCGKCEFVAKTKDSLKRHLLSKHTPDDEVKWFECGHCEYKAKFKATLVQHLMKNH